MQITVIEGSPHLKGASSTIASKFIEGATEAGHTVDVVEVVRLKVGACRACNACGASGPCIQNDDIAGIRSKILSSDMVVLVTPVYFCGFTAQLKTLIDRFYSFSANLKTRNLKVVLIAASADKEDWTMDAVRIQYDSLCRYLNFQDCGRVLATGCDSAAAASSSKFMDEAYQLGKSL